MHTDWLYVLPDASDGLLEKLLLSTSWLETKWFVSEHERNYTPWYII